MEVIDMKKDISPDKADTSTTSAGQDRRRSERRQVALPAFIGDAHSDPRDFETGTVLDISLGGIHFSIPKGATIELSTDADTNEISVLFTLPNNHWRTNVICRPQRVFESEHKVQIGATVLNPDIFFTKALHNIM
jgi:hypothetical protein